MREQRFGEFRQQRDSFLHPIARAIPLHHREFRIMQRPPLGVTKRACDLIDGRCSGGQQPLHRKLGRCLQPHRPANIRPPRIIGQDDSDRVDMPIDCHVGRQQRCLDFQKAAPQRILAASAATRIAVAGWASGSIGRKSVSDFCIAS